MQKYTRGEVTQVILSSLLVAGIVTTAILAPNAVQIFKYFGPKTPRDREKIRRSLTRLERQHFLSKKSRDGEDYFSLTPYGRKQAMRYKIDELSIKPTKTWGGKWYLVMFDIPEEKKYARRAVSRALKNIGCTTYQKSVFITPYPCKEEIDFVGECFSVRKYIRVVVAQEIENVEHFKKHFGL